MGRAVLVREANERAHAHRPHLEWALRQPGLRAGPISFRAAAQALNARGIESPTGPRWRGQALQRMARRLGLDHPLGYFSELEVNARVQTLWRAGPQYTPVQVVAHFNGPHRVCVKRVERVLRRLRQTAAERCALYARARWPVDRWTATRSRIAQILDPHPHYSGRQVLTALGTRHPVRLKWVWEIMSQYHAARRAVTPAMRRRGRRFYPCWRARR